MWDPGLGALHAAVFLPDVAGCEFALVLLAVI